MYIGFIKSNQMLVCSEMTYGYHIWAKNPWTDHRNALLGVKDYAGISWGQQELINVLRGYQINW